MLVVAVALICTIAAVGCSTGGDISHDGEMTVTGATIDWPANPAVAAVRLTISNDTGVDDVLVGVTSPDVRDAGVHRSGTDADGRSTMSPVPRLDVPEGESVVFEAGGLHVMLEDPSPDLEIGDTITLDLEFERAGLRTVRAKVVEPGSAGEPPANHE